MKYLLASFRKPRSAVRHQPTTLGHTNRLAKIGFARRAEIAFAALGRIKWNDMVANFQAFHTFPDFFDHRTTFMAKHRRKYAFGILTGQRECVGMTNTGGDVSQQNLTFFRAVNIDFFNFEGFAGFPGNCSTRLHFFCPYFRESWSSIFARLRTGR